MGVEYVGGDVVGHAAGRASLLLAGFGHFGVEQCVAALQRDDCLGLQVVVGAEFVGAEVMHQLALQVERFAQVEHGLVHTLADGLVVGLHLGGFQQFQQQFVQLLVEIGGRLTDAFLQVGIGGVVG